ncbi:riboflavin kinase [Borealophlyctis nickersoniae]|nr:riboflavin kinase [Borealophlyctis nickersoniae]
MSTRRPSIVGEDEPKQPYPVFLKGAVSRGFGRGSKELGIPTANLPEAVAESAGETLKTGIYYGWAAVGAGDEGVQAMVMSYGWNPYYKNEKRSAEVHIMHEFKRDFYGEELRIIITGYIRPEKDYTTLGDWKTTDGLPLITAQKLTVTFQSPDALIEDINTDIRVAHKSLERPAYSQLKSHEYILGR